MSYSETNNEARTIAIFDFDGTLAKGDSLWPFLLAVAGRYRCYMGLIYSIWGFCFARGADKRTIIKARLLSFILKNRRISDLQCAIARMRLWPRWMKSVDALKWHAESGHHVVVATGSLDLYIKEMLGDLPYHAVICTEMELKGGVLTGRMVQGNCVRECKANRVAAYMHAHGPFEDSWAYGNAPHDLPMMKLTKNNVVV